MKISAAEMFFLAFGGFLAGAGGVMTLLKVLRSSELSELWGLSGVIGSSCQALAGVLLALMVVVNVRTRSKKNAGG